ncbi:MAG: type II toxin-antitoxin system HipA family toxin [Opitutaceae bacterium]
MDELNVFVGDQLSGVLSRSERRYSFHYLDEYEGPPVFIGWPLYEKEKQWEGFPAAFDGLLPEGVLLEQLLAKHKLDRSDQWGQLTAVGQDLTGFLCILPVGSDLRPVGKVEPGQKLKARTPISPPQAALPYAVSELVTFHSKRRLRMSLSGVQPKVSAIFSRKEQQFEVVEQNGAYILKPSPQAFPRAAENEVLTMQLARDAGLDVPLCGYVKSNDEQGVFWIERFDRQGQGNLHRLRCEDACQVLGVPSSFKYAGNFETLARMIREHCSNPKLQLARLFHRVLFCWVTGNGDMHLKNWSLVENGPLIELSPVYDFLNTVILTDDDEESALSLDDKKVGFDKALLIDYLGREVCELNDRMLNKTLGHLESVDWRTRIKQSYLDEPAQLKYQEVVEQRMSELTS